MTLTLHGYWRSSAAYRVRIALHLKGLTYAQVSHDLRTGEQRAADYLAKNPQGFVPALEIDGEVYAQSGGIIEMLDELHPDPPLLPPRPQDRAKARAMAAVIACDIHPLNNLRVLKALREIGADEPPWVSTPAPWARCTRPRSTSCRCAPAGSRC